MSKNLLLILDLDETLIHASSTKLDTEPDFFYEQYFVYKRPFLDTFFKEISAHFLIGIWSSADDIYVQEIIQKITPENINFEIVWGKNRCSLKRDVDLDQYIFEKRLKKLKTKGFKLEQVLIVDDTPEKVKVNYGNAIYINPFRGEKEDKELLDLYRYLLQLKSSLNVRPIEKRYWKQSI